MRRDEEINSFDALETVIRDDLRFKARLRIGEEAYMSARTWNVIRDLTDAASVASGVAWLARSSAVASTFFAPKGILGMLGVGVATTPPGWVAGAAVAAGIGWYAIGRAVQRKVIGGVTIVPDFINSSPDVLGRSLFGLMAPVALKIAFLDGKIASAERAWVESHFVADWGFDPGFVRDGLASLEARLPDARLDALARRFAEFIKRHRDCNHREMSKEFLDFLHEIVEIHGSIDTRRGRIIDEVRKVFNEVAGSPFRYVPMEVTPCG